MVAMLTEVASLWEVVEGGKELAKAGQKVKIGQRSLI